jgi:hypothetical protein
MENLSQYEVGSPEYSRAANRNYYERHKEEEKARTSKWRKDNKEWWDNYYKENKETIAANSRKHAYGITQEQFEVKIREQDGKCAICYKPLTRPDVDHDHTCCPGKKSCGKCTRGILCHGCNTFIGLAGDSIEILSNAIQYLKGWQNGRRQ